MLTFELTKDTPYLALSGELWSVFCEYFNRNWPCYKGFLLYVPPGLINVRWWIWFWAHSFTSPLVIFHLCRISVELHSSKLLVTLDKYEHIFYYRQCIDNSAKWHKLTNKGKSFLAPMIVNITELLLKNETSTTKTTSISYFCFILPHQKRTCSHKN